MTFRQPRGYVRNIPAFREICEGVRPSVSDVPLTAYTGLPHVRVDEIHHDPIVLDPGTLVGTATGTYGAGTLFPCTFITGGAGIPSGILAAGSTEGSNTWGLPDSTEVALACGIIKPLGVIFQPIYSFLLQTRYTNYKRVDNVGILTDYVISIPAINYEEAAIFAGDLVMAGSGCKYGIGADTVTSATTAAAYLAGRYARYNSSAYLAAERVVGRCLRKLLLGATTGTAGETLETAISNGTFTISSAAQTEFAQLAKVQTVPGLGLSGSGTSGIPAYLLKARCDAAKNFYALTLLIRL